MDHLRHDLIDGGVIADREVSPYPLSPFGDRNGRWIAVGLCCAKAGALKSVNAAAKIIARFMFVSLG